MEWEGNRLYLKLEAYYVVILLPNGHTQVVHLLKYFLMCCSKTIIDIDKTNYQCYYYYCVCVCVCVCV